MKSKYYLLLFFLFTLSSLSSQIIIDEKFDDWDGEVLIANDTGDEFGNDLGIDSLLVASDEVYIYFKVVFTEEINLQEGQNFTVYIDFDSNTNTGFQIDGVGSDLSYTPGFRSGFLNINNGSISIDHHEISLITAPTISSKVFEFGIRRSGVIQGNTYAMGDIVRITSRVGGGLGLDKLPNQSGGFEYTLESEPQFIDTNYELTKSNTDDIRILSYNSEFDGLFDGIRNAKQKAIIKALDPDIIAFQEIYDHSANEVRAAVEEAIPLDNGTWYSEKVFPDIIVVSRYPITEKYSLGGNGVFNIQALDDPSKSLILFNCHFACCENNDTRQDEADEIMSFINEMKFSPGPITVQNNSPFIILGDLNLVGYKEQLQTLITGDIQDEFTYGPDVKPDWNGEDLMDAKPFTIGYPAHFTWSDDASSYPKGRLDFMIYSGSNAVVNNSFILNTELMSDAELNSLSLSRGVTAEAADHLPVVADFDFSSKVDEDMDGFTVDVDCNDNDSTVYPGAEEICDGIDNNCDGDVDEDVLLTFFVDNDMDGFGDPMNMVELCELSEGYSSNDLDCNDNDPMINPDAEEICDGIDNNCDGGVDEGLLTTYYADVDMDGYGDPNNSTEECDLPPGMTDNGLDCNDNDPAINPDAEEIANNGIDENCDGMDGISSTVEIDKLQFVIFPNPVLNKLIIDSKTVFERYEIFDHLGKMIGNGSYGELKNGVDVSSLNSGIYFIGIEKENRTYYQKFIKK